MRKNRLLLAMAIMLGGSFFVLFQGDVSAQETLERCKPGAQFQAKNFSHPLTISNPYLPMTPGTQLTFEGRANRGGGVLPHKVVFVITDLNKEIKGIPTIVAWDTDTNTGQLVESELAFFAQDQTGRVWNLGEYPEEYKAGVFVGSPNTWISGMLGARGGIHMLAQPQPGTPSYQQGYVPRIDFYDCGQVVNSGQTVCVPAGCFNNVIVVEEWNPLDPEGGKQLKYHAPGVGIIKVEPLNDPEGETLVLTEIRQLSSEELNQAHEQALLLDQRGLESDKTYKRTEPAQISQSSYENTPSEQPQTAGSYTVDEETGNWESDKYVWSPETGQTQGKPESGYIYNPETNRWDSEKYVYNAETGTYELRETTEASTVQVAE